MSRIVGLLSSLVLALVVVQSNAQCNIGTIRNGQAVDATTGDVIVGTQVGVETSLVIMCNPGFSNSNQDVHFCRTNNMLVPRLGTCQRGFFPFLKPVLFYFSFVFFPPQ